MRINALRKELTAILTACHPVRMPALRRSRQPEWLYSTDAPTFFSAENRDRLFHDLAGSGWTYEENNGWIQLRKNASVPPEGWFEGSFGPEASCCLSLLKRHICMRDRSAETVQMDLIKAGEEGEKAYEEACSMIHRTWAERLRQGIPLPIIDLKYFGG